MTLEEAIKHCKDVALSCTNKECALEHFQLLKWLREYSNMLAKQDEQKPAWSEEDEAKITKLKSFIAQCNGFNKENRNKAFELIDSIKPRYTWKPSEEQIEALDYTINVGSVACEEKHCI